MSTKTKMAPKTAAKPKLDLEELQQKQLSGEPIDMVAGNQDDFYEFAAHEADRLHIELSKKENDPVKKEYVTRSKVVKLYPLEFDRMEKNGSFAEYDSVVIKHD